VDAVEQAMAHGDVTPAYFSYHLSTTFNDGLLHLPYAIEFVRVHGDSQGPIGEAAAGFVYAFQTELADMGVMDEVAQLLRILIDTLAEASPCGPEVAPTALPAASVAEAPPPGSGWGSDHPLDVFLDALHSRGIPYGETTLFESLVSDWVNAFANAQSSVGVLSFFMRLRLWPGNQRLFRDNWVLGLAFDPALCSRHWALAEEAIVGRCPLWYVELMKQHMLGH